jgi:hypothetical protein
MSALQDSKQQRWVGPSYLKLNTIVREGMTLAEKFTESYVRAIENVGPASHFNERYADYKRHRGECVKFKAV